MRRTIPLIICSISGFTLIVAYYVPAMQWLQEFVSIAFDVLASIAFVLGGGNLLRIHLKKISDRQKGWAYSVITLVAFILTLMFGLSKWGSPPAPKQEFYGEQFVPLSLSDFPYQYTVAGEIPDKPAGQHLHTSVVRQLSEKDGKIHFVGWMTAEQKQQLLNYKHTPDWQKTVDELYEQAQPPAEFNGQVQYYADRERLSFSGHMNDDELATLTAAQESEVWRSAIQQLYDETQVESRVLVPIDEVPAGLDMRRLAPISPDLYIEAYDEQTRRLGFHGPMSEQVRDELIRQFPVAVPFSAEAKNAFQQDLEQSGPLNEAQRRAWEAFANAAASFEQLQEALQQKEKLNQEQAVALKQFADAQDGSHQAVQDLITELEAAGPFSDDQKMALNRFLAQSPTAAERKKELAIVVLRDGPLTEQQRSFLLDDYRHELHWRDHVNELFLAAHEVKYSKSGSYRAEGRAFWWIYEYMFKPLTATMFAMLAFYVASAAFRAFRAKNIEAVLLLGTAFLILLGRTFAGAYATSWLPEGGPQNSLSFWLSQLRIENLSVIIMMVFNTAGNRAIMIGIALGIVATSLKILLGIDRSYLGSGED